MCKGLILCVTDHGIITLPYQSWENAFVRPLPDEEAQLLLPLGPQLP